MKLLVVEDERPTAAFLYRGLTEEGFAVDVAANAAAAAEAVASAEYDAVILDVMLPGASGFELCRMWRAQGLAAPILFLTARDELSDRVEGLNLGGDDYLVKPFAFDELLARVRALLRRGPMVVAGSELRVGELTLDLNRRVAILSGQPIVLSQREFQLLEYLARNAGKVVSRTALWEHVWESDAVPDSNVVDVYVRYLRNKFGRAHRIIQTVRGAGYLLDPTPLSDAPTED